MADNGISDFFISDVEDEAYDEDDEIIPAPTVVRPTAAPAPPSPHVTTQSAPAPAAPAPGPGAPQPAPQPSAPSPASQATPTPAPAPAAPTESRPHASAQSASREERLVGALNDLMANSPDIQASALVSMDGFIMASALPAGMQEDRVGAMSAAILGLGERAAVELGRGHLTQVFIEGADGYVMLVAAGDRGVLTVLAPRDAKLGLVLYDMKTAADVIADILG